MLRAHASGVRRGAGSRCDGLQPSARPSGPAYSCDNVERTASIELASPDWRPGASPFGHVRSIWYPRQDSNLHDSAFVARPLHSAPRGHVSFWSGRGDSNSHLQLGRLRPCRWATPAHVSKSWRPWLESNQQDAGLESAPVPPPHGQRLLGGCRESNPDLPVHSRASCQLNEHPRTPTNWSCEPDSNRHPSDTGRPVTL